MARTQQPHRTVTERIDGERVVVRLFRSDPDFAGRVEIEADESWAFGVDAEGVARLLTTTATAELAVDVDPPEWVLDLLVAFDGIYVEGVEEV
ncbi:hypothetical protein ACFQL1_06015 [Halomicroarcula sp. GCM10025709]|uniref:hypothetical protein n=1 Tax=Haloarcula TaxID=2237 RepID=UPI0024C28A5F|nr:hypothetical protein [Halomicroarcula sp. YJ-61-S]